MNYDKITDVVLADVDLNDYPDFCDAYIVSASYDGCEMTEEELDEVNENSAYVYEQVQDQLF